MARLGMDKLSGALGVSLITGALGLVAIFITQANKMEADIVFGSLLALAGYMLWFMEFKPTLHIRTGDKPIAPVPSTPTDNHD